MHLQPLEFGPRSLDYQDDASGGAGLGGQAVVDRGTTDGGSGPEKMNFTTRDLMFVIVAAAVHFGSRYWFTWGICIPPTVALVAAVGLSRSTRGILFSFWVGTFAGLASAAEMTVEMFQVPIEQGGLPWSRFWDVALHMNATFALVGAAIGTFVGFLVRLASPATKS